MGLLQRTGQFVLHRLPVPQAGLPASCVVVSPRGQRCQLPSRRWPSAVQPRIGGAAQRAVPSHASSASVFTAGPIGATRPHEGLHERLLRASGGSGPQPAEHVRVADVMPRGRNFVPRGRGTPCRCLLHVHPFSASAPAPPIAARRITSASTSSPRCHRGGQCMKRASGLAAAIISASTHQSARPFAGLVLGLVAHAGPNVGGDQIGALAGFERVAIELIAAGAYPWAPEANSHQFRSHAACSRSP